MMSTTKIVDTRKEALRAGSSGGVQVNGTGRRTYTPQYKADVVKRCSAPGVSVAGVALAHGINANLVRRWIVHHRRTHSGAVVKPQVALLPVTIEAGTSVHDAGTVTAADTPNKQRSPGMPSSRSSSTAHAFICAAESMRRHCAPCSTCWRGDDRAAGGHARVDCRGSDRHASQHERLGGASANHAGRESVLRSRVRLSRPSWRLAEAAVVERRWLVPDAETPGARPLRVAASRQRLGITSRPISPRFHSCALARWLKR